MFNSPESKSDDDPGYFSKWSVQVDLFLLWVFEHDPDGRSDALWKFVDLTADKPASEEVFERCFNASTNEVKRSLGKYLSGVETRPFELARVRSIKVPDFRITFASPSDLARVQGDFALKEARFVGKDSPYVQKYMERAEAALLRSYQNGTKDPALIALLGLYYFDLGNMERSRPLLQEATDAHVRRPMAYLRLAQILYLQALESRTDGILTAEQVRQILRVIAAGAEIQPAQPDGFILAVKIWDHATEKPTSHDIDFLKDGAARFSNDENVMSAIGGYFSHSGIADSAFKPSASIEDDTK